MTGVRVSEVKWNAVGRRGTEQAERWMWYLHQCEKVARARVVPGTFTIIGAVWDIDCDDREHAAWLHGWLQSHCGYMASMLKVLR